MRYLFLFLCCGWLASNPLCAQSAPDQPANHPCLVSRTCGFCLLTGDTVWAHELRPLRVLLDDGHQVTLSVSPRTYEAWQRGEVWVYRQLLADPLLLRVPRQVAVSRPRGGQLAGPPRHP